MRGRPRTIAELVELTGCGPFGIPGWRHGQVLIDGGGPQRTELTRSAMEMVCWARVMVSACLICFWLLYLEWYGPLERVVVSNCGSENGMGR